MNAPQPSVRAPDPGDRPGRLPLRLLANAAFALLIVFTMPGCATHNVNPATPEPGFGYVDFYSTVPGELSWEVQRHEDSRKQYELLFSELKPIEGRVLRLALAPGQHSLRVTFLNRVVGQLGTVHVDVQTGKVVPVEVKLAPIAGKVLIEYRPERYGATFRGRYGRGLNRTVEENSAFAVTATAGEPLPFAPKRLMPYAELPAATRP